MTTNHDPSRALKDLTGTKKNYYRKYCKKTWKCEKCPKSHAVKADWKAHSKVCGSRVYGSECGAIFSRRDSCNSHKKFCDALRQESARNGMVNFTEMAAAAGGNGGLRDFFGGANLSLGRQDLNGGADSDFSRNQFGNNLKTGFTPLAAGYNLNSTSPKTFEDFVPQPTNPNPGPTNFLAHNDLSLRSHHDLIRPGNKVNNTTNLGYFQDNTKTNQTLFTHGADNNHPSALLRGLTPSSSGVVNENGNLSMGGSNVLNFDFLGVNGRIVSNGRGGRNPAALDTEMTATYPNNPYGNA